MGQLVDELEAFMKRGDFTSDGARALAERTIEAGTSGHFDIEGGFPPHDCYWNDRLAVAVMFGVNESLQRRVALQVMENGGHGYFEPVSHFGYDVNGALASKGVPRETLPRRTGDFPDYQPLNPRALDAIAKAFGLEDAKPLNFVCLKGIPFEL